MQALKPSHVQQCRHPCLPGLGGAMLRQPRTIKAAASDDSQQTRPQAKTYTVEFSTRKPAGLVFSQKGGNTGPVYVDEITPGGEAEKTGKIRVGDVLIRCSAMLLKDGKEDSLEKEGYGERLYNNWEKVVFDCRGQEFRHVMSALKSNNSRMGIPDLSMTFQRG